MIWWSEVWLSIFSSLGFGGALVMIVALLSADEGTTAGTFGFINFIALTGMIGWTTYGYVLIGS